MQNFAPPDLDADVIVVGAGPAGAATAAHLARAGRDVLVVDRCTFPRDKICGDFVGPVALRELELLGLAGAPAIRDASVVPQAGLFLDGEHLITFPFEAEAGLPAFGRVVPRVALDAAILAGARTAGARLLEGAAVTGIDTAGDRAVLAVRCADGERTLRARLVVGADGSGSSVARIVRGRTPPRDDLIVAVRAYYDGVAGPSDRCDVYFGGESFPGYAWIFPAGGGVANVGVGMVVETFPPAPERLDPLLQRLVERDAGMRARLGGARMIGRPAGWPLSTFDESLDVVGERVLLAGDAASLVNPLNGEGIQYALCSGRWAAEAAVAALAAGDCSRAALLPYQHRVRAALHGDVAFARLIVRAIANRSLNGVWLGALRAVVERARVDREYARVTGGVVAGIVPAREALRPDIVTRSVAALSGAATDGALGALARPLDALAAACAPLIDAAADPGGAARWAGRVRAALRAYLP